LFAGKGQTVNSIAWPLLLDPKAIYAVGGRGSHLQLTGSALMTDGLETARGASAARVVQLSRQPERRDHVHGSRNVATCRRSSS
jgi:hypothetical protein